MTPQLDVVQSIVAIAIGLGLAAAAGFRVFVPLLVLGVAARTGHLGLAPGFDWLSTSPALVALGTATLAEVLAYYVPWLDHALDLIATPAAVLAGVLASVSVLGDLPPALRWGVGVIGGGSAAGLVQGATVLARLKSAVTTAGVANPLVATVELVGSLVTSLLSFVIPFLVLGAVAIFCIVIFAISHRVAFGRRRARDAAATQ